MKMKTKAQFAAVGVIGIGVITLLIGAVFPAEYLPEMFAAGIGISFAGVVTFVSLED